jgi:hypothetical protein
MHLKEKLCPSVRPWDGLSVYPNIALNVIFAITCGRIDLKFGGDLLDNFLFFSYPFCSATSPPTFPSTPATPPSFHDSYHSILKRSNTLGGGEDDDNELRA